jgi:uncharacterized protein (DUF1778 family)
VGGPPPRFTPAASRSAPERAHMRSPAVRNVAAQGGGGESSNVMPARNAEERAAYAAARKRREHIGARYTKDEAQRIRNAVAGAGMSLNAYMLAVVDGRARPVVDLADVARLSTALAALMSAPRAVRDLEADLGRLSGRLSHLFTVNYKLALEHRAEIHATLNEVRETMRWMQPAIAALQAETAEPRAEIVRVLRAVNATLKA